MAKKAKKKKAKKPAKAVKAKKAPARKAKAKTKAKKAPAKKAAKAKARKAPARKASAKKPPKITAKKTIGEGDYAASRAFLKDQANFVKRNEAKIPAMGRQAEMALEGPEGADLRAAEAAAASHSKAAE